MQNLVVRRGEVGRHEADVDIVRGLLLADNDVGHRQLRRIESDERPESPHHRGVAVHENVGLQRHGLLWLSETRVPGEALHERFEVALVRVHDGDPLGDQVRVENAHDAPKQLGRLDERAVEARGEAQQLALGQRATQRHAFARRELEHVARHAVLLLGQCAAKELERVKHARMLHIFTRLSVRSEIRNLETRRGQDVRHRGERISA
mmetsp:Transcript_53454/g.164360  ORF Transcript_53454/g.164360 Transcript_53454/m.164360 type:complete len:207 (+) Transcript_53454:2167-2787(+)